MTQKDLWGAVPKGLDLMSQGLDRDGERSGKPEVTDLDITLLVHQKVLRFQVPVDNPFGVAVIDTTEDLVQDLLFKFS